jgi:hypothetical protein
MVFFIKLVKMLKVNVFVPEYFPHIIFDLLQKNTNITSPEGDVTEQRVGLALVLPVDLILVLWAGLGHFALYFPLVSLQHFLLAFQTSALWAGLTLAL